MICPECGAEHSNPKFCSRSCSAKYNNRMNPKRKPEHRCIDCGVPINAKRKRCRKHYQEWIQKQVPADLTLSEATYAKGHRSSAYALVRTRARAVAKKLGYTKCAVCGYDKHIEIAHIKGISEFSEDTLLTVINAPDNLIALCPNHHWEYDAGVLDL